MEKNIVIMNNTSLIRSNEDNNIPSLQKKKVLCIYKTFISKKFKNKFFLQYLVKNNLHKSMG